MERLEKQIELIKDAFIIYCAKRFEKDPAIQDMINDIRYFESKKFLKLPKNSWMLTHQGWKIWKHFYKEPNFFETIRGYYRYYV